MAVMKISDEATRKIRALMADAEPPAEGIRVGVKAGGCSGLTYAIEYAQSKRPLDEEVEKDGVKVFIDPMALMYLLGSTMDWRSEPFAEGFVFENPNAKSQCGCGESFAI